MDIVVQKKSQKCFSRLVWPLLALAILINGGFAETAWARDVIVGGQSLGIVLKSEGAVVVGFTPVQTANGEAYPAKDAGVEIEDMLLSINGETVNSNQAVQEIINRLGEEGEKAVLHLRRKEREYDIEVSPVLCAESGLWRIGMYIRDMNAGIGTLTFYDPQSGAYGALGHQIESGFDGEEGDLGRVLSARVQYVQMSEPGEPGEKVGVFDESGLNGSILKNCELGIYGVLTSDVNNEIYPDVLPVAETEEVEVGAASMLTVLEGEQVEEFAVEIVRLMPQKHSDDKGMVIEVVDERLLTEAGGIVQGMSGSPLIQNGKLIGAVTHVFVNEANSGYACFAEWMLEEADTIKH